MARVAIVARNSPGQISDVPAEFLPPEAWTTATNVRSRNGVMERVLGQIDLGVAPGFDVLQQFAFRPTGLEPHLLLAGATQVSITDGITTTDITGASTPAASGNGWTFTNFNGIPVLNEDSLATPPQALMTIPGGPLVDLPNWPAGWFAKSIRSFKDVLVGLNVTKAAVRYPNMLVTSAVADPGTIPITWDETDPQREATEQILPNNDDDDDIEVIDGLALRDLFVIYKRLTTSVMTIGGANLFTIAKTFDKGVMNKNCIARPSIKEARHVCFGIDDIYLHNGYTEQSILEDTLRDWLFDRIDPQTFPLCHVAHHRKRSEVWFLWPELGATLCTHAVVWNYIKNSVTVVEVPDTYWLTIGPFVEQDLSATWDSVSSSVTWDTMPGTWDALAATALRPQFIQSDTSGLWFFDHSTPWRTALLERQGLAIAGRDTAGQPIYDTESVKYVNAMWPRFKGNGTAQFYIGGSDTPSGAITWAGPYGFDVASKRKVDCRNAGRILHTRFVASDMGQWRMLGYDLDISPAGGI